MRTHVRSSIFRAGLLGLVPLFAVTCTADSPQPTGTAEQAVINPPLPTNLNLILNAKTTVTIGSGTQVVGDVASSGVTGSVLFNTFTSQQFNFNVLANKVTVNTDSNVGSLFGNDITVKGNSHAVQVVLGLDPTSLPQVPAGTPATPGTTNVSTRQGQAKQLCPGQYGAISLGRDSILNLNGGVYQVTRLHLADGARLEPSEPVVILVAGSVTTGFGAIIRPSPQVGGLMADNIRIEVGDAVTLGASAQVRAHLLVPTGKFTTGANATLQGAIWAKTINIGGPQSVVNGEGVFAAQAPPVGPPCNDHNACTTDQCVSPGGVASCKNTPLPSGTSCEDGRVCNGAETCDGAGQCQPGTNLGAGASCSEGDPCNGDETCDGLGTCEAGTPPEVNDRNPCTADACDSTGVSHTPLPDGTPCFGVGVCQAGVCSVAATVFSDDFFQFQGAPVQCNDWNNFLDQLTAPFPPGYSAVMMSGTFDPTGVTCSDPAAATQICGALHNRSFASVSCNGHMWNVGQCGGTELNVDTNICFCSGSHTVRPCTGFEWGGVNTQTCEAPSQNMTVACVLP